MAYFPRRTLGFLIVLSVFTGCSRETAAPAPGGGAGRGGQAPAVPVAVAQVERQSFPIELLAVGTTQAYSVVDIRSQVTGELTSVNFKEGDDVRQGQVLFTLDRRPLEAALETAQGALERDTVQATLAETTAKRYQDLMARGIVTREQADQASTQAAALAATLTADRGAVALARLQLQYATIVAPFSGRTGQLRVHPGNLVRANDTIPLVTINQIAPIHVAFGIPESRLDELKRYLARNTVRVEAAPAGAADAGSSGRITFIDNSFDPTSGMITIKAEFPNRDYRLWPGQFANVRVTLATNPDTLVIPAVAVQTGQQGDYVFVIKPDQSAEYRKVALDRTINGRTAVREGLAAGELVVTDGQLRLTSGTPVTIKDGVDGEGG